MGPKVETTTVRAEGLGFRELALRVSVESLLFTPTLPTYRPWESVKGQRGLGQCLNPDSEPLTSLVPRGPRLRLDLVVLYCGGGVQGTERTSTSDTKDSVVHSVHQTGVDRRIPSLTCLWL